MNNIYLARLSELNEIIYVKDIAECLKYGKKMLNRNFLPS